MAVKKSTKKAAKPAAKKTAKAPVKKAPAKKCAAKKCACGSGKSEKSCGCKKGECSCKKAGLPAGVCLGELVAEVFSQLEDNENIATLMKDYFFTELIKRGINENIANTLANRLDVTIESFEAQFGLVEDEA